MQANFDPEDGFADSYAGVAKKDSLFNNGSSETTK